MDDDIHQLETDDSPVSENDKYIIDMIFNNKPLVRSYHVKQIILATLLYSVMSLPMIDFLLSNVIKTTNPYYRLAFKTSVFFLLYFLIINYIVKN
jgi:hypothetical protein